MKLHIILLTLPLTVALVSCNAATDAPAEQAACEPADKVIVANFHGTRRCASCIAVGEMAQKTITQKFAREYRKGTIEFLSINGELPENWDMVQKYQARGSSLFLNAVRNEKEMIEEEGNVWRLIGNETNYIQYFEGRLRNLLECS